MTKRITLETGFSATDSGLKNVSLITTGIEAAGHGIYLDEKTAEGAMKKLLGRSVKSYLRHEGAGGDRLGNEIGFFSGIYRQGAQIKASAFEFLESFKKDSSAIADRIVEMAQKVPDQFGVSLVLEYMPVWVMADGSEVQAVEMSAPAGAVRPMPSMRVLDVISADFVGRPAANPNGLLSADTAKAVDATADKQPSTNTTMTENRMFPDSNTVTLSCSTNTTGTTATAWTDSTGTAWYNFTDHEAKIAELSAAHVTALAAKDGEISALTAALAAKDEAHKAALEKAVADAIAPLNAKVADLETFDARKLGVAPIKVAKLAALQSASELPEPAKTDGGKWDQYTALLAESPEKAKKFRDAYMTR